MHIKKILSLILTGMLALTLCACQPTPDKPFVESKNDGELQEAVYGTQVPELIEPYAAPETWVESIEGDNGVFVNVDAILTIPDVTLYPVYRVTTTDISNEEANLFIQAFAGDTPLYSVSNTRTKDVIQKEIDEIFHEYGDPDSLTNIHYNNGEMSQEEYDYYREQDEKKLAGLQAEYKKAAIEPTLTEMEKTFKLSKNSIDLKMNLIMGVCRSKNDTYGLLRIVTEPESPHGYNQDKSFYNNYDITSLEDTASIPYMYERVVDKTENLNEMTLSYEDAKALAEEIVHDKLGYADYAFSRACAGRYKPADLNELEFYVRDGKSMADLPEMYIFYYTPTVDGIPLLYYKMDAGDNYNSIVYPKYVCVAVRDEEHWSVSERSTMQMAEKLNNNVALLPFDEIQDIFRRYITIRADNSDKYVSYGMYRDDEIVSTTYNITDIRLGYVRIVEKDNISGGILVPVWNFYGQQVTKYCDGITEIKVDENNEKVFDDDPGNAFLCINAIDGSVINLDVGY